MTNHLSPSAGLLALLCLSLLSPQNGPGPGKPTPRVIPILPGVRPLATTPPDLYLGRPRLLVERLDERRVRLAWNAVPETRTQGYRVERSLDGDHWLQLAYVDVNPRHRYRYLDTSRVALYYRVVRLEWSRRLSYSPPVRSTYGIPLGPLVAQPNPARGTVRLLGRDPLLSVDVLDAQGQLVSQIYEAAFSTQDLRPGVYALRQGQQITRFVVR